MNLRYSVNIVCGDEKWILRRAADELRSAGFEVDGNRERSFDFEYFIPYLAFEPKLNAKTVQVGLFTHREEADDRDSTRKAAKFESYKREIIPIAISKQTQKAIGRSCPVIHLGSQFPAKAIRFGVCGRVQRSGRKNEEFIAELIERGVDVVGWGEGWPCPIFSSDPDRLRTFYSLIDYLIIPSGVEGGPVPLLEALSLGIPVIAPDVGWSWEYPVIRYERDSFESLWSVVKRLTNIPTWDDWRARHVAFFNSLGDTRLKV